MTETELRDAVMAAVKSVRSSKPLAGSVTNAVTMDFVANAQLAVGGSAAMVYLPDEAEALVGAGSAFYVNMGTLLPVHEQTIPTALATAHAQEKTCVLDPVGIGIGSLRKQLLQDAKQHQPKLIRGNASEVIALAGLWELVGDAAELSRVRGVDTTDEVSEAQIAAVTLARYTGGAVMVSGEEDLVTDGSMLVRLSGGSSLMERVTGFGCSLGGVAAVYAAVADPFVAAVAAASHYNIAGRHAKQIADAPGLFKVAFMDELYKVKAKDIAYAAMQIEQVGE